MIRLRIPACFLTGCALVAIAGSGCGRDVADLTPSSTVQRDVAQRFAAAVLRGDARGARKLLTRPNEAALVYLVQRAAEPWTNHPAPIRLAALQVGQTWTIHYAGTRTHKDGTFERERGDLVVFIAPSATGAVVRYFMFRNVHTRFSTHHDAQLPPSKR